MDDKFEFLNAFREEATEKTFSLTLSIGMSYGLENFSKIGKTALDNLELALVRGGDQVVIKKISILLNRFILVEIQLAILRNLEHALELSPRRFGQSCSNLKIMLDHGA